MTNKPSKELVTYWRKMQDAQRAVSNLWILMCQEEGVPVDAKFVVFNSSNKYSVEYNAAVRKFFHLRSMYSRRQQEVL